MLVLGITSCTKKTETLVESTPQETTASSPHVTKQDLSQTTSLNNIFQIENEFLDYLRFAGSVETEIFKIVDSKFKNTQKIPSQLMILSQLLDSKFNKKTNSRSVSIFYNCYKMTVQSTSVDEFEVSRACEKNGHVIAKIKRNGANLFQVTFIQSEWQSVIGDSAVLNLKDKVCQLVISNKKVFEVSCDHTLITIGTGAQLEEIKLHNFKFDRDAKNQIIVTGGRFKDFLERSKINILVPEEGKIKFKEVELVVRDDYADVVPKVDVPTKDFVPPAPPLPQVDGASENGPTNELDMNNPQVSPPPQPSGR